MQTNEQTQAPVASATVTEETQALVASAATTEQAQAPAASAPAATEQAQAQAASVPAATLFPLTLLEKVFRTSGGDSEEEQASNAADFDRDRSNSPSAGTYRGEVDEEATLVNWADDNIRVSIPSGVYEWQQVLGWAAEFSNNPRVGWANLVGVPHLGRRQPALSSSAPPRAKSGRSQEAPRPTDQTGLKTAWTSTWTALTSKSTCSTTNSTRIRRCFR